MNRDDIIRMAKEAGICTGNSILLPAPDGQIEALDRFAALVAEREREACAKVCDEYVGPGSISAEVIRERNEQEKPR